MLVDMDAFEGLGGSELVDCKQQELQMGDEGVHHHKTEAPHEEGIAKEEHLELGKALGNP